MTNNNIALNTASVDKKDEFYTQFSDIEKEIEHYPNHFRGKFVYCNCDDPTNSNFFKYFLLKFADLGLKKLITTCYRNQNSCFQHDDKQAIRLEYDGFRNGDRVPNVEEIGVTPLNGDGDFRSTECIDILKGADIVVTNPPFSLFREFVAQLIKHDKKFLIVGNVNAISYKDIFPLIRDNRIWLGPSITSGDREFRVPNHYPLTAVRHRIDEYGNKFVRVKGVRWYTNLDHQKRHECMVLYHRYTPEDYPTYDNYDAIEVSKTKYIPDHYYGAMGVPITFLDKYNPDQFEILGMDRDVITGFTGGRSNRFYVSDKRLYARLVIRKKMD